MSNAAPQTVVWPARRLGKTEAIRGSKITSVFVDEAKDIDSHTLDAMKYALAGKILKPVVQPENVPCRYCHAVPGETCQKWKRGRRGKFLIGRDPHPDRKHDARLATEAVRALSHR